MGPEDLLRLHHHHTIITITALHHDHAHHQDITTTAHCLLLGHHHTIITTPGPGVRRQRRFLISDGVVRMGTGDLGALADLEDTMAVLAVPAAPEDLVGRAGRDITAVLGEGPWSQADGGGGGSILHNYDT